MSDQTVTVEQCDRDAAKFWAKVERSAPGECWNWLGHKNSKGYGCFYADKRKIHAHRFSYELNVGPIPVGLVCDHLCRNTSCVNPAHLEPVTARENTVRGNAGLHRRRERATVTHCIRGHPLSGNNLRIQKTKTGITRQCWTCRREIWNPKSQANRKAKTAIRTGDPA